MSMSRPASPAEVIPALATALRDARVDDALALYEPEAAFVPQPHAGPLTSHGAISAALTQFAAMRPTLAPGVAASSQLPTSQPSSTIGSWWGQRRTVPQCIWRQPARTLCVVAPTAPVAS